MNKNKRSKLHLKKFQILKLHNLKNIQGGKKIDKLSEIDPETGGISQI